MFSDKSWTSSLPNRDKIWFMRKSKPISKNLRKDVNPYLFRKLLKISLLRSAAGGGKMSVALGNSLQFLVSGEDT